MPTQHDNTIFRKSFTLFHSQSLDDVPGKPVPERKRPSQIQRLALMLGLLLIWGASLSAEVQPRGIAPYPAESFRSRSDGRTGKNPESS